jgi:cytochrome P450
MAKQLREQEPLIQSYIDLLISNIREDARQNRPSNMVSYFNWVTFDLIGDLSFARSFDALKTRTTHPWILTFFSGLRVGIAVQQFATITLLRPLLLLVILPLHFARRQDMLKNYCDKHITERIESGSDRPDFLGKVLEQNSKMDDKAIMSREEINVTFNVLMIAGSETTATLLAGCTYLLQKNPAALKKLRDEIIAAFKSEEEITMLKVSILHDALLSIHLVDRLPR